MKRLLPHLALGPGPEEVADGHAEPVGQEVGEAQDQDTPVCSSGPATPATTAKVVTGPSTAPYTKSRT